MNARQVSAVVSIGLLLLPTTAPAPIYSPFSGLDDLIKEAEFIIVAEIVKRPGANEWDMGGGGIFEIDVVWSLKGDVKVGKRHTAYLRDLRFGILSRDGTSLAQCFDPNDRYLLFLNKSGTHTHEADGTPVHADFEAENSEGDVVWISSCGNFDLEWLKGKNVREAVVALLNESAKDQQRFVNSVEAMLASQTASLLMPRISQIVWVDNPEEAANFYLSVFKEGRRDPNLDNYRDAKVFPKQRFTAQRLWISRQDIVLLSVGAKSKPSETTRLTLNCDSQEEINYYWEKLSEGGERLKGGWVKDKFGVYWHIVPADLWLLLGGKYGDPERVKKAMMEMDVLDILALGRAARGD